MSDFKRKNIAMINTAFDPVDVTGWTTLDWDVFMRYIENNNIKEYTIHCIDNGITESSVCYYDAEKGWVHV